MTLVRREFHTGTQRIRSSDTSFFGNRVNTGSTKTLGLARLLDFDIKDDPAIPLKQAHVIEKFQIILLSDAC
jgi:hypothetical protein